MPPARTYRSLKRYMRRRDIPKAARTTLLKRALAETSIFMYVAFLLLNRDGDDDDPELDYLAAGCALIAQWRVTVAPLMSGRQLQFPKEIDYTRWANTARFAETFRVPKLEVLKRLATALRLPDTICTPTSNNAVSCVDALAALLARMSFPCRLVDLQKVLQVDWHISKLSAVINQTIRLLDMEWGEKIMFDSAVFSSAAHCETFSRAIAAAAREIAVKAGRPAAVYATCVGFIDGTVFKINRPGIFQRAHYNGHKRFHCLRFQGISTPDGMVYSFYGPCRGSANDRTAAIQSDINEKLHITLPPTAPDAPYREYCIYGDGGYTRDRHIFTAMAEGPPGIDALNKNMNAVRTSVEQCFGDLKSRFAFIAHQPNLKIYSSPVAAYSIVAMLLNNCYNCLYPNQVSQFFGVQPPVLEEYLTPYAQ